MSTLYLIALGGVCLALLGALWEAVAAVSRRPKWEMVHTRLRLVHSSGSRHVDAAVVSADQPVSGDDRDVRALRKAA